MPVDYEKATRSIYEKIFECEDAPDILEEMHIEKMMMALDFLKTENDMLNMAIDNCVDSFHICDGRGIIVRVNHAFEEKTGVSREMIEGKHVYEMERESVYQPSVAALVLKEQRKLSLIQSGRGGDVIATANPVFDDAGAIKYIVSNARFIDELYLLDGYYKERKNAVQIKNNFNTEIVYSSKSMKETVKLLDKIAATNSSILMTGETGTGKSLLAKYVHEKSARSKGHFVEINCAAIPDNLIESELFGYESGAFTGAKRGGRLGLIELADKGTLFLDEIGDMPINLQAKLLQVLQNKKITKVGGEAPIDVDIRIICATNKDLEAMIKENEFREDLYYRINVVPVHIPSLRERREEIPSFLNAFTKKFNEQHGTNVVFGELVIERLCQYDWPGNIRELENFIERLIVTDVKGIVELTALPAEILIGTNQKADLVSAGDCLPLKKALDAVERKIILNAYESLGSSYKVAEKLEISQSAASRKIIKYTK